MTDSEDDLPLTRVNSVTKIFEIVPNDKTYTFKFVDWGADCKLEYLLKQGKPLPHVAHLEFKGKTLIFLS